MSYALTLLWQQQSVCSHTVSRLELELRRTSLLRCNFPCNRLVSVQTGLKERETTDEIKCEPEQTAAVDLLSSESQATAYASLLAKVTNCSFIVNAFFLVFTDDTWRTCFTRSHLCARTSQDETGNASWSIREWGRKWTNMTQCNMNKTLIHHTSVHISAWVSGIDFYLQ